MTERIGPGLLRIGPPHLGPGFFSDLPPGSCADLTVHWRALPCEILQFLNACCSGPWAPVLLHTSVRSLAGEAYESPAGTVRSCHRHALLGCMLTDCAS